MFKDRLEMQALTLKPRLETNCSRSSVPAAAYVYHRREERLGRKAADLQAQGQGCADSLWQVLLK